MTATDYAVREEGARSERVVLLDVTVAETRRAAEGVRTFVLRSSTGADLPAWTPGAHVDVILPSGLVRQYSLCSDPRDLSSYRIAILEIVDGRGGSIEAHRELRAGTQLQISPPRNTFPLVPAAEYLLIAGGIGITPMLAMAVELARRGERTRLVYAGRRRAGMALLDEVATLSGAVSLDIVAEDESGRPDFAALVSRARAAAVYACGPSGMLDVLADICRLLPPAGGLHVERFAPAGPGRVGGRSNAGFEVELVRSELLLRVGPTETVLDAVRAAGIDAPSSCEQGFCGTCETRVIAGTVDHRDDLLSESERAAGNSMMICVSRARECSRLVLDL